MDPLTKEQRRRNMQAIKCKGTSIEVSLGKALWQLGLHYRKNNRKVPGKPDFSFSKYKVAVFADSEFWHGKDWYQGKKRPETNSAFWKNKIERNIQRDQEVNQLLKEAGWTVLRFWGKDIEKDTSGCAEEVRKAVLAAKESRLLSDRLSPE